MIALPAWLAGKAAVETAKGVVKAGWKFVVGAVVIAPLAFGLGQCSGASNERAKIKAATITRAAPATARAADERLVDERRISRQTEELKNAVVKGPDTGPDPAARRLQCERLRARGVVPAACR